VEHPVTDIEVYADISCPFTHVGLLLITEHLAEAGRTEAVVVKAWPLEWVNGTPLAPDAVEVKIAALRAQVGMGFFAGFHPETFPSTTIPALNLASDAYAVDAATGLAVSMELRHTLFELGLDVSDHDVLAGIARRHGLDDLDHDDAGDLIAAIDLDGISEFISSI
jgi:predicted DsbA family dithiol-disulfide isomerase